MGRNLISEIKGSHTVGGICFATPNPKDETRIGEVISCVNGAQQL